MNFFERLQTLLGSNTSLLITFLINAFVTPSVLLHFQLPPTKNLLMLFFIFFVYLILNLKIKIDICDDVMTRLNFIKHLYFYSLFKFSFNLLKFIHTK